MIDFDEFHRDNPHVYTIMVNLAKEWVRRTGRSKLGIAMLFERARWELALQTTDAEYKLNNNYKAYYARLIMHRNPDLGDLFDLRCSDADEWLRQLIARERPQQGPLW